MSHGETLKLDFRCQGQGCAAKLSCRRFLYGQEAKNSAVPFAAIDARLANYGGWRCDGFLPRGTAATEPDNADLCDGPLAGPSERTPG